MRLNYKLLITDTQTGEKINEFKSSKACECLKVVINALQNKKARINKNYSGYDGESVKITINYNYDNARISRPITYNYIIKGADIGQLFDCLRGL